MTIVTRNRVSNIYDLEKICWSGALTRVKAAIDNGYGDELYSLVEEYCGFDDNVSDTAVNDFIWFASDDLLTERGVLDDEEDEDEEE